jgi:hypothetical protein
LKIIGHGISDNNLESFCIRMWKQTNSLNVKTSRSLKQDWKACVALCSK